MPLEVQRLFWRASRAFQILAMFLFASMAVSSAIGLIAFMSGLAAWPVVLVQIASGDMVNAAPVLVGAVFVLSVLLLSFMPANWRVLALENSHRSFRMRMEDVTRAYTVAHAADRAETFQMASEFHAVRERIVFLRDHPDLGDLEPDVLDVAAQMSRISEDLAARYSDAKVTRAKSFLAQRRDEAEAMDMRIEAALDVTRQMRRLIEAVEMEESVAASRLEQLRGELDSLLPQFDLAPTTPVKAQTVVRLAAKGTRRAKAATARK